jgi:hypothetical protein
MDSPDLSEQMALYAIDALAADDRAEVDAALLHSPALQQDLADFERAVTALAYGAPPVPMADDLKDRLMQRLSLPMAGSAQPGSAKPDVAPADTIQALIRKAAGVTWERYPLAPNTQVGMFCIDETTREIQCFIRATGTVQFPAHRHAHEEELILLDGDLSIDGQPYQPGDRIYSRSGTAHQPATTQGCFLFLRTSLDDEILQASN